MTLPTLAIILSWLGVAITLALAVSFLVSPAFGMAQAQHRLERLPRVMTDRYVAFVALALGATLYGDLAVTAYLFAVFAFMGFADAVIYARSGHPNWKHIAAGVAATIVSGVIFAAYHTTGVLD
jgi:hypothetical protein